MKQPASADSRGDIIVVDDDLFSLRVLTDILASHGYQVRSARSGSTALMMARAAPPELFLLDIEMPGMDGFQVCMELKGDPATQNIPVLFISAGDAIQGKVKSFEVGGTDYISKPFQEEETLARVNAHLTIYKLHSDLIQTNSKLQNEIHEREQSQLALRASETSLRAQYQGIPLPTTTWTMKGNELILTDFNRATQVVTQGKIVEFVGFAAEKFFWDQPKILKNLYQCLKSQESIEYETDYRYRTTGENRFLAFKFAFFPPNNVLVHTEDITERKQIEGKLVNRISELSALHRISKILTIVRTLPESLKAVCEAIADLFQAPLTLISFHKSNAGHAYCLVGYEHGKDIEIVIHQEADRASFPSPGESRAGDKPAAATRFDAAPLPVPVRDYLQKTSFRSGLIVPLFTGITDDDVLIICRKTENAVFEQYEIDLAETVAADIASAIKHEYLSFQARQAAVDAERQRLARDLHDSVTQSIYSLTLLCSGWETMARQGKLQDPADSFHCLGDVGQQALREMRLLLYQLRPYRLEAGGLLDALRQRLNSVESHTNIDAQLIVRGNLSGLPRKVEEELYNIAQEALNNSLKHARTDKVRVLLEEDQANIRLIVEDYGKGFDTRKVYAGMGLVTMQERARSIAGEFSVRSEPDCGTKIMVSVEIDKDRQQQ